MLKEFRDFLQEFNVIPFAIGVVLALAILPVIEAVVNVILSIIGAIFGADVSFDRLTFDISGTPIPYGTVLTALFSFVLIAAVVFMMVKGLKKAGAETDAAPSGEETLLTEIRDLLKQRAA